MKKILLLFIITVIICSGCAKPPSVLLYHTGAQTEIISKEGVRVLVDVSAPSQLSSPITNKDILLITHRHSGHFYAGVDEIPDNQMIAEARGFSEKNVQVTGIASSHGDDTVFPKKGHPIICILSLLTESESRILVILDNLHFQMNS